MVSKRWEFKNEDFKKVLYNAAVFLAPVGILFLGNLATVVPESWMYGSLALYVLNVLTDALKKWASKNTYK